MRFLFLLLLIHLCSSLRAGDTTKTWEVVINEIMADPDPAPGTVTYPEYVEFCNRTNRNLPLKNWKFCVGTICKILPDVVIPSDSFLVLTSQSSVKQFGSNVNVLGIAGFPALTNTGQVLQLQNAEGNIIHAVSYTDNWYQDAFKKNGGYSLEQLDVWNPCGEMNNWRAAVHPDGGTPGKRNSVAVINKDVQLPEILRVSIWAPDLLEVIFSESIDSTTLMDRTSYRVSGMGHPNVISLVKPSFKSVVLRLGDSLKKSVMYTLQVEKSIKDCAGNSLQQSSTTRFAIPSPIHPNNIVINEVLFNPRVGGVDFVEIYNCSQQVFDLKTLFICHYDTLTSTISDVERITASSYLFFPGEYLVLTENASTVKKQYPTADTKAFFDVEVLPAMNADEGNIALKTATELIDHFTYQDNMHFALLKETRGISLERVHFRRSTNDVTNWHSASSSVDFATPGYKNSQFVEELLTDKTIQVYPEVFSPDEDGIDDQMTIHYQFDEPVHTITIIIYDAMGREVKTLVNNQYIGTEGSYSWDGINDHREKQTKGMYIIFVKTMSSSGTIKSYKKIGVLSGKN